MPLRLMSQQPPRRRRPRRRYSSRSLEPRRIPRIRMGRVYNRVILMNLPVIS